MHSSHRHPDAACERSEQAGLGRDPVTSRLIVGTVDRRGAGALAELASELSLGGGLGPGLSRRGPFRSPPRRDDVGGGSARGAHPQPRSRYPTKSSGKHPSSEFARRVQFKAKRG
jgi:hypothetical protein